MKLSFKIVSLVLVMSLTCSPLVLAQVRTITCNYCGNYVASTSRMCPTCGKDPKSITGSAWGDLFLLVLLGGALSSNSNHQSNNSSSYQHSPQMPNQDFTLTGTIGSNNNIHGYVNINGNQISGNYGYKSNPYGCTVKGQTYENGSMRATETEDKSGKITGEYRGEVVSNNKIKGTFYSKKYRKKYPFTWLLH